MFEGSRDLSQSIILGPITRRSFYGGLSRGSSRCCGPGSRIEIGSMEETEILQLPPGWKNRCLPGTQMTLVLLRQGLVLRGWPSKIEVIWVLGRWWFEILKHFWNLHPDLWGNDPIWRAYFSKGWPNHQLDVYNIYPGSPSRPNFAHDQESCTWIILKTVLCLVLDFQVMLRVKSAIPYRFDNLLFPKKTRCGSIIARNVGHSQKMMCEESMCWNWLFVQVICLYFHAW